MPALLAVRECKVTSNSFSQSEANTKVIMTADEQLKNLEALVHDVLAGDVIDLRATNFTLNEMSDENRCEIQLNLYPTGGNAPSEISGAGVGVVDATMRSWMNPPLSGTSIS